MDRHRGGGLSRGTDIVADIDAARRDHAIEGRAHLLERLGFLDAALEGLRGGKIRLLHFFLRVIVVGVLLRHGVFLEELVVTPAVTLARSRLACACFTLSWACLSCWSVTGVSISASRSFAFTLEPMSNFQSLM